jgi:cell division protein FtsQ
MDEMTPPPVIASEAKQSRAKRKKRKKKHYILRFFVTVAIIAGIIWFINSKAFDIGKITVEGNARFTVAQIEKLSGVKIGDNLFRTSMSEAEKKIAAEPYIKSADIKRKIPPSIIITVSERTEAYIMADGTSYLLLDAEREVLAVTGAAVIARAPTDSAIARLPILAGFKVNKDKPGAPVEVKQTLLLKEAMEFYEAAAAAGIKAIRIDCADPMSDVRITDTFTLRGSLEVMKEAIPEIKSAIANLTEKQITRGTLIISDKTTSTFSPKVN